MWVCVGVEMGVGVFVCACSCVCRCVCNGTVGVVLHLAPPAMQAALQHPQLLLGDVARGRVHGHVRGQPGLGEGLVDGHPLLRGRARGARRGAGGALGGAGRALLSCAGDGTLELSFTYSAAQTSVTPKIFLNINIVFDMFGGGLMYSQKCGNMRHFCFVFGLFIYSFLLSFSNVY